tara:strand:+ start:165 stop:413 length:249 start_codon:yes stop_codon:yes gene_type:complete
MDIGAVLGFILSGKGVAIVMAVLPFILPNKVVSGAGRALGKILSAVLCQKCGKGPGEKVEKWFQGTVMAFISGLNEGLDADD